MKSQSKRIAWEVFETKEGWSFDSLESGFGCMGPFATEAEAVSWRDDAKAWFAKQPKKPIHTYSKLTKSVAWLWLTFATVLSLLLSFPVIVLAFLLSPLGRIADMGMVEATRAFYAEAMYRIDRALRRWEAEDILDQTRMSKYDFECGRFKDGPVSLFKDNLS